MYFWLICGVVWQKPTQHCKVFILQLKIKRILKQIFGKRKPLGREVMYFNTPFNKLQMMNFSFRKLLSFDIKFFTHFDVTSRKTITD